MKAKYRSRSKWRRIFRAVRSFFEVATARVTPEFDRRPRSSGIPG
jgi:hypothetical protein